LKSASILFLLVLCSYGARLSITDIADSSGKYLIVSKPSVLSAGDTLTVPRGREVLFGNLSGITVSSGAVLLALGEKDHPVYFTSLLDTSRSASPFDWNGIEVKKGAFALLSYCFIAFSSSGITAEDSSGIELRDCIFSSNGQWNFSLSAVIQNVPDLQPFSYLPLSARVPEPRQVSPDTVSHKPHLPVQSSRPVLRRRDIILGGGVLLFAAAAAASFYKSREYRTKYNSYVPGDPPFDAASLEYRQERFDRLKNKYYTYSAIAGSCFGLALADALFLSFTVRF
jgi:hypothetical protein